MFESREREHPHLEPDLTMDQTAVGMLRRVLNGPVNCLQKALRTGTSTRLDERVFAMCEFKTQPLQQLMRMVHPDLYRLDNVSDQVSPTARRLTCLMGGSIK